MPAAVAIGAGVVSAGTSAIQAIGAGKRARQMQEQIDNYKRQELKNAFEGLQVSTLGADRQREDLARTMATYGNLAAMGGSRAIVGLAPNLIAQQNSQEAQIMANLDEQEKQRQQLIANGAMQVQNMQEQRENNDLLGMGNALNTYRHEQANAWNQATNSLMATGMAANSLLPTGGRAAVNSQPIAPTTSANTTTPVVARTSVQMSSTPTGQYPIPLLRTRMNGMWGKY
jgi:hypothetical protein|nr:MAG TPA: hypothetical protein [Crassvirales sp.]